MKSNDIYLSLGSNLGDRLENLQRATVAIGKSMGNVIHVSSVFESAPWGVDNQADYLNLALMLHSDLEIDSLMSEIQKIERALGRDRKEKWGPRTVDIDILLVGDQAIKKEGISIPHPEMINRRFVLQPLSEIAPKAIHPVENQTVEQLLDKCPDKGAVWRFK
ncbi:MAG: 2-amino-4-hydroxy-6-hydroxymethyldihydropteridine diphosphokinase [Vicingaceae bacterium]